MTGPELDSEEVLLASFVPNRGTYIREHILLAALGSVLLSGLLMFMGNPHAWTGIVGSVLAIAARGAYAMNEQLGMIWHLTNRRLIGPDGRKIGLSRIDTARTIFSATQILTTGGDKYLIKYQSDPASGAARILDARDTQKGAA